MNNLVLFTYIGIGIIVLIVIHIIYCKVESKISKLKFLIIDKMTSSCSSGDLESVKRLIWFGVDINKKDSNGSTD